MKRQFTTFVLFFVPFLIHAQNLTILTTGQTGTSGTNWSITGNTLNVASSGTANIHPDVISNHLNNVGDLTVILPWQSGQIRQCSIDGTITYTGSATRTLTFLIANDIFITSPNQSISATGSGALNVVLRAANTAGVPDHGRISIRQNNTINTNGGHLWIGGGSGNVIWNGLVVGNDFARTWAADIPGLWIENATLITNGGNFEAKGQSWYSGTTAATLNHGIRISGASISSGNGSVVINGSIRGNFNNGIATFIEQSTTNGANVSTTSGNITITGVGTSTSNPGWRHGIVVQGVAARPTTISTVSGNISVHGTANYNGFNDQSGLQIQGDDTRIVSQTGNITLKGTNPYPAFGQFSNAIRFANPNVTNALRIGFDGTNAYSGNIIIEGNSLYQRHNNTSTGSISIQTTGGLTIQPEGDAFTHLRADASGTLTFEDDWNFGTNLGSFTFGKTTNTSDITFSNDLLTNGPITVYANKIIMGNTPTISAGESARLITSGSNGHISLLAKNGFETLENSACIRGKIMTNGGNIHINADADNNNTGTLNIDWLTIDHSTGSLLLEGAVYSWNIGNTSSGGHCPLPEIYGSGSITFRPTNNSTQNFHTSWISLIGNKASLTLGSSTNNFQNIIIEPCTSCLGTPINGSGQTITTTNGPIEAHGFVIEIKTNLKTTGSGDDILLRAQRRLQIYDGTASTDYRSLQTNNGDIVLWTNTINELPGGVVIGDWVTLNSANGNTNQSTGGGKIWIAGGSAVNSDGLPTGPANGGDIRSGVGFGTFSTGSTTTSLYSGGGDIFINGESNATVGLGISWNRTGICYSGNGTITIKGEAKNTSGSHGIELGAYNGSIDILSSGGSSSNPAIAMEGKTVRNDYSGMQTNGNRMQATGAGGISIITIANNGGTTWSNNLGTSLLAASGDILISAQGGTGLRYVGTIGKLSGSNVTSSSSNITLRADQITVHNAITVDATGTLVVEPFGTSFTNALSWPLSNFSVAGVTGLRLGKSGNTANITTTAAQSIAGPIEVYGGTIAVNADLTSTATTGTGISLNGQKISHAAGITSITSGSNISYLVTNSPWTAAADIGIDLNSSAGTKANINAQGGNIEINSSFATTGTNNSGSLQEFAIVSASIDVLTSGSGTITINGDIYNNASTTGQFSWGVDLRSGTVIRTENGNISITGRGGRTLTNIRGVVSNQTNLSIVSNSGTITLTDLIPSGNESNYTGMYFRPSSANAIKFGSDGSLVTSSSSNINFIANRVTCELGDVAVTSTGKLTIAPEGNSFGSSITTTRLNLSNSLSELTIGKSGNTGNITLARTTSIAGPITIYGGTIAINENISSTNGSSISLFGNALTFGTNKTVTSNNGQLIIAPQNASNTIGLGGATGTLSLPASYFSTNFSDGFSNIQIGSDSQTGNIAANTFTLRDNMTFLTSGSLTLGGKPVLGNNNITLGDAISSITASASNYFQTNGNGKVMSTLANNASRLFPVGNAFYNGVTITNKTNASDTFSVLIKDSVLGNGDTGRQITTPHVKATWDISKNNANGGNGVDFDFNWNASQEEGGINTFVLNHHNDTVWQIASGTAGSVSGTTTKTMSHTGYMGRFSPFAFGPGVTPLPVELIKFIATCQSDYIQIDWTTASEIRNKAFELYKSDNAQDWKFIHTEAGQGDKATATNYTFKDLDKKTGYYRLKDIDEDGIENWSQIIFADCKNDVSDIQVYPNPATDYIKVIAPISENTILKILNLEGKILKTMPLISNQTLVSVKDLVSGIYMIEIEKKDSKEVIKLIKY